MIAVMYTNILQYNLLNSYIYQGLICSVNPVVFEYNTYTDNTQPPSHTILHYQTDDIYQSCGSQQNPVILQA